MFPSIGRAISQEMMKPNGDPWCGGQCFLFTCDWGRGDWEKHRFYALSQMIMFSWFLSSPQGKVTLDYPIRLCVWELVDATTKRTCPLPSHKVIAKKRCMDKQKSRGFHRSICTNGGGRIQFPPHISQMLVKQTSLSKGYIFA